MGRTKTKQKRIGPKESRLLKRFLSAIKNYRFKWSMRNDGENSMNKGLLNVLMQQFDVHNHRIPSVKLFDETFRPEFFLRSEGGRPICALECKLLRDSNAKGRWKEGLSQAILYSHLYKKSILLLYDFTKDSRYWKAFGRGNKSESKLAKKLRKQNQIDIIAIKAFDK